MKRLAPGNDLSEQPKKKSLKQILKSNLLRRLLMLVFIGIFLFSFFKVVTKLYAYHKENSAYERIRASIQSPPGRSSFTNPIGEPSDKSGEQDPSQAQVSAGSITTPPPLPYTVFKGDPNELNPEGILKVYSALKTQNADLVGWISMPGFRKVIDYPVMQSKDNEFYLTHDFYKNKSYSGSIFMDSVNRNTEPDRNIILYGHAMKDMSMFGNLREYPDDQEKYGKNTTIFLDFLNMQLEYQVFSAYSTESNFDYRRIAFQDDADFLNFLETIKEKSEHDFGFALSPLDKIITLSTCDESYGKDGRTVIHAKLVKQIIYDGSGIEGDYAKAGGESGKRIISSNVYLNTLSLQYTDVDVDDSQSNVDSKTTPSAIGNATPAPNPSQAPNTSPASVEGEPDTNAAVLWQNAVLDPPFTTTGKLFSTKVPATAVLAKLSIKADDPKAGLSYTLNGVNADPERLVLVDGDNILIVRVVSVDGLYARAYTLHVFREPSSIAPQPGQTPLTSTEPAVQLRAN